MPHANNKIYINKTVSPNIGIDVRGDIAPVLGRSTGDVGQLYWDKDASGQMIANPAVNMWSRHKPVPWSINGVANLNPRTAHPNDWHVGINGDFGIKMKTFTLASQLPPLVDGGLNGWAYERDSIVARALDFENYYHVAPNPFDYLFIALDKEAVVPGGTLTMQYQLQYGGGTTEDEDSLGILDLQIRDGSTLFLEGFYAAILIYKKSGNTYTYETWASASETIETLETDRAMHSFQFTAPTETGTYVYIPILSRYRKTNQAEPGYFISIPGTDFSELTVSQRVNPYMTIDAFVYNRGTSENPNYHNELYFIIHFMGGTDGGTFNNISLGFLNGINNVPIHTLGNVQHDGSSGGLEVYANADVKKPAGSGNYYYINWPSSAALTLENLVRNYRGKARIYPATTGSGIPSSENAIREAAGLPSGRAILFGANI